MCRASVILMTLHTNDTVFNDKALLAWHKRHDKLIKLISQFPLYTQYPLSTLYLL